MGWARGSEIAIEVWELIRRFVPEYKRKKVAMKLYDLFCDEDADDWDGTSQLEKDAGLEYEE